MLTKEALTGEQSGHGRAQSYLVLYSRNRRRLYVAFRLGNIRGVSSVPNLEISGALLRKFIDSWICSRSCVSTNTVNEHCELMIECASLDTFLALAILGSVGPCACFVHSPDMS